MRTFPVWINDHVINRAKKEEESYLEEIRKIKEKADRYDKLINTIGYQEFIDIMVNKVNAEIIEATNYPLEPERQRVHVIRWNAMREVVDAAIGDIEFTRKERDRIAEEERQSLIEKQMYQNIQGERYGE